MLVLVLCYIEFMKHFAVHVTIFAVILELIAPTAAASQGRSVLRVHHFLERRVY